MKNDKKDLNDTPKEVIDDKNNLQTHAERIYNAELGDTSLLTFLKNYKGKFEEMPMPEGTPEERLITKLPKIEQFIQEVAIRSGAGEFMPQNTENMTVEDRLNSINQRAHMAMEPYIQKVEDQIAKLRGLEVTPKDSKKLN